MKYLFKRQPKPIALAVATAVAMSCAGSALAQDIEELVIQAERRDTTESTTAISMEVLTAESLAENQIRGIEDLQNQVPNIQFNTNGFGWAQANIRGIGNPSGGGPGEQVGVPVLVDGGTQGEEVGLGGGFFDVGNVQVLRGPQGTFIGQSAAGGAILINSARPNFDGVNGYIQGQMATYDQRKLDGAVNLPISDTLAARVAFLTESRGSFYSNQAGGVHIQGETNSPGSSDDVNIRLGLLWEPSEKFTLYTKLEQTKYTLNGTPSTPSTRSFTGFNAATGLPVTTYSAHAPGPDLTAATTPNTAPGAAAGSIFGTVSPNYVGSTLLAPLEPFQIAHPLRSSTEQNNTRYIIDFSYELDNGMSVSGLTSHIANRNYGQGGLSDRAFGTPFDVDLGPEVWRTSQELTLLSPEGEAIDWVVGVAAGKRHTEVAVGFDALSFQSCGWQYDGSWSPCATTGNYAGYLYLDSDTEVEDQSIFGQLNWNVNDELELTFGARWSRDDITARGTSFFAAGFSGINATNGQLCNGRGGALGLYCPLTPRNLEQASANRSEYHGETPTGKVGLNWSPSDDHFFYAFYARGYKSGQAQDIIRATGAFDPADLPVTEELVDDYEFGWKGTLLDGALYAEFGVFYTDYSDMQLSTYATSATTSGTSARNAGASTIEGFEGSFRTNIGNLNINGSFGYTKSEIGQIDAYENRAFAALLPSIPAGSGIGIGDLSKGCAVTANQLCFDFSPYQLSLNGSENLNSPELSYSLSADYPISLDNGATLTPRLSLTHADESFTNLLQVPGENYYTRDERDVLNLSVTYDINDWSIQGFINNLTDETYVEQAGGTVLYGAPRVAGLRARMNF